MDFLNLAGGLIVEAATCSTAFRLGVERASVRRAYKATWLSLSALIFLGVFSLMLVVVRIVERTPVRRGLLVRAVTCGIAWAIQYSSGEVLLYTTVAACSV